MKNKAGQYKSLESVHSLIANSLQGLQNGRNSFTAAASASSPTANGSGSSDVPPPLPTSPMPVLPNATGATPAPLMMHPTNAAEVAANMKTLKGPIAPVTSMLAAAGPAHPIQVRKEAGAAGGSQAMAATTASAAAPPSSPAGAGAGAAASADGSASPAGGAAKKYTPRIVPSRRFPGQTASGQPS